LAVEDVDDTFAESSTGAAGAKLLILIAVPTFALIHLGRNFQKLADEDFEQAFGSLY